MVPERAQWGSLTPPSGKKTPTQAAPVKATRGPGLPPPPGRDEAASPLQAAENPLGKPGPPPTARKREAGPAGQATAGHVGSREGTPRLSDREVKGRGHSYRGPAGAGSSLPPGVPGGRMRTLDVARPSARQPLPVPAGAASQQTRGHGQRKPGPQADDTAATCLGRSQRSLVAPRAWEASTRWERPPTDTKWCGCYGHLTAP